MPASLPLWLYLQVAAITGLISISAALHLDGSQILQTVVLSLLLLTIDQVLPIPLSHLPQMHISPGQDYLPLLLHPLLS